jgi:hypothetical protein
MHVGTFIGRLVENLNVTWLTAVALMPQSVDRSEGARYSMEKGIGGHKYTPILTISDIGLSMVCFYWKLQFWTYVRYRITHTNNDPDIS